MASGHFSDFLASKNLPPPWPLSSNSSVPSLLSNSLPPSSHHPPHSSLPGGSTWPHMQLRPSAPSSTMGERARPRSCWTAAPQSSRSSPPSPSLLTAHLLAGRVALSFLLRHPSSLPMLRQSSFLDQTIIPCSR